MISPLPFSSIVPHRKTLTDSPSSTLPLLSAEQTGGDTSPHSTRPLRLDSPPDRSPCRTPGLRYVGATVLDLEVVDLQAELGEAELALSVACVGDALNPRTLIGVVTVTGNVEQPSSS